MSLPLSLVFEFARGDTPEDPYAFNFAPQTYTLRTEHGGRKSIHLDWSEELLADLVALNQPHVDPAVVQRVGRALHTFLEPAGWSFRAQAIAETARQSRRVNLTIRSAAAELYALPWELLSLEGTGQFVGELPTVLLRYEWPETHTTPALASLDHPPRGRLVMAWSEAGGAVPHRKHIDALRLACRASGFDFDPDHDVLPNVSVGKLADALERAAAGDRPISALHLLCHGGKAGHTSGVMLDGEQSGGIAVDAARLRQILAPYASTLRLVVLMACESAEGGEFDSIAQSLHRAGIQLVVGSRFLLSVPGSISVAETLYQSLLCEKASLEEAFLDTRRQLARDAAHLDWASLQLYARQADGEASHPLVVSTPQTSEAPTWSDVVGKIAFGMLDMPTLIKLRDLASRELAARFTRDLTLTCIRLIESEGAIGSLAPVKLDRCRDILAAHAMPLQGFFFTAAESTDALYVCFPDIKLAIAAMMGFCEALTGYNYNETRENQLVVAIGVHHAAVFSDGKLVSGRAVDMVREIARVAGKGLILLSEGALRAAPTVTRALCAITTASVPGDDGGPAQLFALSWRDDPRIPALVRVEETGETIPLPAQDLISFGRLDALPDGSSANDIVLGHPDEKVQLAISRWHFELRRVKGGYVLRSLSRQGTQVDDRPVEEGEENPVGIGTVICLAKRLRLILEGGPDAELRRDAAAMTIGFTR